MSMHLTVSGKGRWFGISVVLALALTSGCTAGRGGAQPPHATTPQVPDSTRTPAVTLYTVTASLLQTRGQALPLACLSVLLSLPPAGCGGVAVRGLDLGRLPGAHRFGNGTVTGPVVRLVGRWDGATLTLTQAPVAATQGTEPKELPCPSASEPARSFTFDTALARRAHVLSYQGCGSDTLDVVVAVADPPALALLRRLVNDRIRHIHTTGWLVPL